MEKLDYDQFKDKLGGWAPLFKPFIEGKEMWDIYQRIREDAKMERIVPLSKDTFRALYTTSRDDLKVIFYLMDPYPRFYHVNGGKVPQATGIAMDCSNSPNGKLQPSLEIFYDAIAKDLGKKVEYCPNLEYLHKQGVMLFNTDLTCKANKTESHKGLWEPFQKFFLQDILGSDTHIIYVLCGKSSKRMERYINPFCKVFKLEHPAAASHSHSEWDHDGIFNKINRILRENKKQEIFWNKKDWDEENEPPF